MRGFPTVQGTKKHSALKKEHVKMSSKHTHPHGHPHEGHAMMKGSPVKDSHDWEEWSEWTVDPDDPNMQIRSRVREDGSIETDKKPYVGEKRDACSDWYIAKHGPEKCEEYKREFPDESGEGDIEKERRRIPLEPLDLERKDITVEEKPLDPLEIKVDYNDPCNIEKSIRVTKDNMRIGRKNNPDMSDQEIKNSVMTAKYEKKMDLIKTYMNRDGMSYEEAADKACGRGGKKRGGGGKKKNRGRKPRNKKDGKFKIFDCPIFK